MIQFQLKKLIKEKGVTYRQVSEGARISTSTLNKMIQDEPKPVQSDVLDRLLEYFDCDLTDLIIYIPNRPRKTVINSPHVTLEQLTTEALTGQRNVRLQNREALILLYNWSSEPDELGQIWWDEFEHDLKQNRLSFRES